MIDKLLIREKPQYVIDVLKKKDPGFDSERMIELESQMRHLLTYTEELRHKKNELAKQGQKEVTQELRDQARAVHAQLKEQEAELEKVTKEFNYLYLRCPNLLSPEVPAGGKEENKVVKVWGEQPKFNFEPKNHVELGQINNWFDFEAAARMASSGFVLYKNQAVKLVYNLMLFMLNNNIKHGYNPVLPPYIVNAKTLEGASNFPRFQDEVYSLAQEDNLYLTPTAEVNLTALYRDAILKTQELPINMTAWTSCFRREAGGYGAAERGLIRIHQFEKVELYTICTPEQAEQEQQNMLACAENILQALGLHYRVSLLAAQDCSFASAKTYDIEVWMPGQKIYKEVSSASNCTDFQARRSAIRYRAHEGDKTNLAYTLNASSLALPRLLVALMETYQQPDGTIILPDAIKNSALEL